MVVQYVVKWAAHQQYYQGSVAFDKYPFLILLWDEFESASELEDGSSDFIQLIPVDKRLSESFHVEDDCKSKCGALSNEYRNFSPRVCPKEMGLLGVCTARQWYWCSRGFFASCSHIGTFTCSSIFVISHCTGLSWLVLRWENAAIGAEMEWAEIIYPQILLTRSSSWNKGKMACRKYF